MKKYKIGRCKYEKVFEFDVDDDFNQPMIYSIVMMK
jgi:hypothetical protein